MSLHTPPKMNSYQKKLNKIRNQTPPGESKYGHIVIIVFLVLIAGASVWSFFNFTTIRDWYILLNYNPPSTIQALASYDTMTPYATKLFYVNKPLIESKTAFAIQCPGSSDSTHVIGCYHSGDNGIYLLNVTDSRLNGIIQVTAAYEMLHAGYARLSSSTKTKIDNAMWQYYSSANISSAIKQQMASYAISEPGAKYDELYSVLGTEVGPIPSYLENHYKIYFSNRAKIVAAYNGYQSAFNDRQQEIASIKAQLAVLKDQINALESSLSTLQSQLNSQQLTLNNDRFSNNFYAYNSAVNSYNATVNQYNSLVNSTKSDISQYNNLVDTANAIAIEEQQLVSAISATPTTQSTK